MSLSGHQRPVLAMEQTCVSHVVDVWGYKASVGQLLEIVGSFMVAANEDREYRGRFFATIIFVEGVYLSILRRACDAFQIIFVSN